MINKVAIVTDTTACIPQEQVEKYNIEVVPVQFIFGDRAYRDGIDMTPTEFYARLRQAKELPTTAGALPGPYIEAYVRASERASHVLCVTVSAKLSGIFNAARLAMEQVKEKLPDVAIEVLDCGTAAAAQGLVVLAAARAAASGKGLAKVVEVVESVMRRVQLFATLDTLHYLVKGGRVPKAAGLVNSLLKIKPVFTVNSGEAYPVKITRKTSNALNHLLGIMKERSVKGQPLHVAVIHADALDKAVALRDQIAAGFDCAELFITEFIPVIGVHTGRGVIGVAFYSGD